MQELVAAIAAAEAAIPKDKVLKAYPGGTRQMGLSEETYEALASLYLRTAKLGDLARRYQYGLARHQVSRLDEYTIPASLIRRARVLGSAEAAVAELADLMEQDQASAELVAVIAGVSVEAPVQLAPDVQLIPFGWTQVPDWMRRIDRTGFGLMTRQFVDAPFAAAVVKRIQFSPVFGMESQPAEGVPAEDILEVTDLAMCIALTTTRVVSIVRMYWGDDDPRLPIITEPVAYGDPQWVEGSVDEPAPIDDAKLTEVLQLFSKFVGATDSLKLVIKRLNRSRRMWRDEDRAIDVGVALEALLMHGDSTSNQEINFKLGIRAAWLLGKTIDERVEIAKQVRDLYQLRSDAAHQGKLERAKDILAREITLSDGADLVGRLLLAILERGGWPDWRVLVLGGG